MKLPTIALDDLPMPSPKEMLAQLWEKFPQDCAAFFPRRYAMPPGYVNPERVLIHIFAQMMASHKLENPGEDTALTAWILTSTAFREYGSRVYALERDLGHSLLKTIPKGFSFDLVRAPLPGFMVMFPEGLLPTKKDGPCQGALIHLTDTTFSICAILDSGAAYTFVCERDDEMLATRLKQKGLHYQRAARELLGEDTSYGVSDDDEANLRRVTYLVLNILAFLSNPHPDLSEGGFDRPGKRQKGRRALSAQVTREFHTPHMIGERYARGVKAGHSVRASDRAPVSMHWRCGHWRQQPYGKGRRERKLIHVEPVLVGAKK